MSLDDDVSGRRCLGCTGGCGGESGGGDDLSDGDVNESRSGGSEILFLLPRRTLRTKTGFYEP